jgi:hypothetical protein
LLAVLACQKKASSSIYVIALSARVLYCLNIAILETEKLVLGFFVNLGV